jgi:hypothetical protein
VETERPSFEVVLPSRAPVVQPSIPPIDTRSPAANPIPFPPSLAPYTHHHRRHGHFIIDFAKWAFWQAFPKCCPNLPNYNASANTTACDNNPSICWKAGVFEAIGNRDLGFVQR